MIAVADYVSRERSGSERADVLRLRALRALRHVELDALVLLERAVARRLDGGEVGEDVSRAVLGGDEAVALLSVEPLHGSGSHVNSFKSVDDPALRSRTSR